MGRLFASLGKWLDRHWLAANILIVVIMIIIVIIRLAIAAR